MARPVYYADRLALEQEIIRRQVEDDDFDEEKDLPTHEKPGAGEGGIFKRSVRTDVNRPPLRTD